MSRVKYYYGYEVDFGRYGKLFGRMVLDEEDKIILMKAISDDISLGFYGTLGKHSDFRLSMSELDVKLITADQDFLNKAEELGVDLNVGHDLMWRIEEEREYEEEGY